MLVPSHLLDVLLVSNFTTLLLGGLAVGVTQLPPLAVGVTQLPPLAEFVTCHTPIPTDNNRHRKSLAPAREAELHKMITEVMDLLNTLVQQYCVDMDFRLNSNKVCGDVGCKGSGDRRSSSGSEGRALVECGVMEPNQHCADMDSSI